MQRDDLKREADSEQSPAGGKAVNSLFPSKAVTSKLFFVRDICRVTAEGREAFFGYVNPKVIAPGKQARTYEVQNQAYLVEAASHA